jgi:tRNA1Val (adenine37-N6)-methyltransferase
MKVGTDAVLLGAWADVSGAENILDIGTGSGILAIMLAQRCKAKMVGIEIDNAAFLQAQENVSNCPWKDSIALREQSFQEFQVETIMKFNLIICNPPFFINSLKAGNQSRNLARHNGSLSHDDLLNGTLKLLSDEGKLCIIMPNDEGSVFIAEAAGKGLFCVRKTNVRTIPHATVKRILMEFSKLPAPCLEDTINIGTGNHEEYSEKYKSLTKDFYLKF